jgi:hypothetical protein
MPTRARRKADQKKHRVRVAAQTNPNKPAIVRIK